jgi:G3E family GTPase
LAASLVAGIKEFRKNVSPDFLFIEPSEMVVTSEMRNVIRMGLRDTKYAIGPFITLVPGTAFQNLWQERRPLLLGQMAGAGLVALSKSDLLSAGQMAEIMDILKDYGNSIIPLSSQTGSGIEEVVKTIAGVL